MTLTLMPMTYLTGFQRLKGHHLVIPYTLDTNDMRFAAAQGFNSGDQFFSYLKDAFDALYAEGADAPKMLNVGLHCRIIGRPARIQSLRRSSSMYSTTPMFGCQHDSISPSVGIDTIPNP